MEGEFVLDLIFLWTVQLCGKRGERETISMKASASGEGQWQVEVVASS